MSDSVRRPPGRRHDDAGSLVVDPRGRALERRTGGPEPGEPEVGLRLRPDAPLPDSLRSLIYDPNHPDEVPPELRIRVRNLDRDRLVGAVEANGGGVPLVNA